MHRIRIVDRGAEFGGVHIQSISLLGVIGSFHIVPGSVRSRNSCLLKVLSIIASSAVEPARSTIPFLFDMPYMSHPPYDRRIDCGRPYDRWLNTLIPWRCAEIGAGINS